MGYAYRAANVMLFSPLEDNLPFSLMEAMAHGLIPVASEVGGVPDLLPKEKFSELLFGTNQPKDAAKKLLCLMDSSKRRNNLRNPTCDSKIHGHAFFEISTLCRRVKIPG
jgi:glycosyltransferase involved in cell wall biosynthesis